MAFWKSGRFLLSPLLISLLATATAAVTGSIEIFNNREWIIKIQEEDPVICESEMAVFLNGVLKGSGKLVQFHNQTQAGGKFPEVVVMYCSGFVRLKQGADPNPSIPFGTTVVLGPAYFDANDTLFFNPQIERMEIDTSNLLQNGTGTLKIKLTGMIGGLDVRYNIKIFEPSDFQTKMMVEQTCVVSSPFSLNPTRVANNEAFRIGQFSSMFIDTPRFRWG